MDVQPRDLDDLDDKDTFTVLVTGANSGLGFSTCCRLIDEFLQIRPQSQSLHLLFSTRDAVKGGSTLQRLNSHLQKTLETANKRTPGISKLLEPRIRLENVLVDLTVLRTVKALAEQLLQRKEAIDVVVCNAGIAGWTKANYGQGIWNIIKAPIQAVTCPDFMVCDVGAVTGPQLPPGSGSAFASPFNGNKKAGQEKTRSDAEEPLLGKIFTANVFGHYMLVHWLTPLLLRGEGKEAARVIWISSTSALSRLFSVEDMQGIRSEMGYESSKRLTDLLVLTSELPSTRPWVEKFLPTATTPTNSTARTSSSRGTGTTSRPKMYLTHPGVIMTSIFDVPWFLAFLNLLALYFARMLGSPWHPISAYKGAVSMVYAALAPSSQLPRQEVAEGKGKWGSATDVWGEERVARTEVTGWGYCGSVGVKPPGSLGIVGYERTTKEDREEFEVQGREVWKEMELLRVEWERRLGSVGAVAESVDL